jgi:hypothetical protein
VPDKRHALNNPFAKAKDRCSNPRWHENSNQKDESDRGDEAKTWEIIITQSEEKCDKLQGLLRATKIAYNTNFAYKQKLVYCTVTVHNIVTTKI